MTWTTAQQQRYAHHVLLPDVGGRGQARLWATTVSIDVRGVAGQLAALYLAAAGVGTIAVRGGDAGPSSLALLPAGATVGAQVAAAIAARNPEVAVVTAAPDASVLTLAGDHDGLALASALSLAGEVTARWLHACATGAASP